MSFWTNEDRLGLIPEIITPLDPRPVRRQIEERYAHGGGYLPIEGFTITYKENGTARLHYPGDPAFEEWGRAQINNELVIVFDCALVAIVQPDWSFEVVRMD